jgi:prophage tail gpP-like protein
MGRHIASGGETWSDIARVTTGDDLDAARIQQANPGVLAPIAAGTSLQIPEEIEGSPADIPGVQISVNGKALGTWDGLEVAESIDAVAKARFVVPNEPEIRALFRPLSAPKIDISVDGEVLLSGRGVTPETVQGGNSRNLMVSAYAHPGVLEFSMPPISAMPLEWTDSDLTRIANDLCLHHGVGCDFRAEPGPVFKRVDIQENQEVLGFLSDLARQRGPVISSGDDGKLVVWTGVSAGRPVSDLEKGRAPVYAVEPPVIDESKFYSSVTGYIPAKTKRRGKKSNGRGAELTVQNPFATDQVRPFTVELPDIDEGELEAAVKTVAGRLFSDIFSITVHLATWRDDSGNLYKPNTTVRFKSEEDFINDSFEFLIADVTRVQSAESRTTSLRLVLPGVYSGEIPEALPWQ